MTEFEFSKTLNRWRKLDEDEKMEVVMIVVGGMLVIGGVSALLGWPGFAISVGVIIFCTGAM
jgi:hypothetical protein